MIAINNIDEVVQIIRHSSTSEEAKNQLIERFNLSEIQAKAILDMRLVRLVGLELNNIKENIASLNTEIARLENILSSHHNILEVVVNELKEIKEKYGDERITEISNDISMIDDEDLIPREDVVISMTESGYIKRMSLDTFKVQNRGGVGVSGGKMNKDDVTSIITYSKTHTDLLFFSSLGKVYRIRGYKVPEYSRTSKGLPVQNLLPIESEEKILSIISIDDYEDGKYLFFATKQGVVKKTPVKEFASIRQNGKKAILMREDDELIGVKLTNGDDLILLSSDNAKMVVFKEDNVRSMSRNSTGVKGMDLGENDHVISLSTSNEGKYILSISENGYGKMSLGESYRITSRGSKGVITMNVTEKTGRLVQTKAVNGDEDILVITEQGVVIRTSLKQVAISGRNAQGVKIIRIKDSEDKVKSIAVCDPSDKEEIENVNEGEQENAWY